MSCQLPVASYQLPPTFAAGQLDTSWKLEAVTGKLLSSFKTATVRLKPDTTGGVETGSSQTVSAACNIALVYPTL